MSISGLNYFDKIRKICYNLIIIKLRNLMSLSKKISLYICFTIVAVSLVVLWQIILQNSIKVKVSEISGLPESARPKITEEINKNGWKIVTKPTVIQAEIKNTLLDFYGPVAAIAPAPNEVENNLNSDIAVDPERVAKVDEFVAVSAQVDKAFNFGKWVAIKQIAIYVLFFTTFIIAIIFGFSKKKKA